MCTKKIAVIGAGASGLAAIKCFKDEGFETVCFERTDHIGGLWHYTPKAVDNQACVMKSTVINTSKEMMCYSDFPIPKDFPNFMHNAKVLEYFQLYADHFDLKKAIRFQTEVLSVKKAADFVKTGQWMLKVKDLQTNSVTEEIYDGVLVCTGHHAEKNIPTFPGIEDFRGKIVHTHDYKDHIGYENQRVVIIGIGNSGGDVAVELGRVAKQVYLSTRRGSWVLHRVSDRGLPVDMLNSTRAKTWAVKHLPANWVNSYAEKEVNWKFDHNTYGLKPKHRLLSQHPMVNDDLPNRIICGSVVVKANVERITKTGVVFDDGSVEDNIDTIILATGYIFGFPFIGKDVIDVKENKTNLFKYVFPPDLEHPSLAVIGCVQPWGAIMPISEIQCRWAARLLKGDVRLPCQEAMRADIHSKEVQMAQRYVNTQRHTIQVDYIPYMDELAEQVGCRPNLKELLFTDPSLALMCFFSAATPYQYRLHGPLTWPGAREAIMTQWSRVYQALQTRKIEDEDSKQSTSAALLPYLFLVLVALVLTWLFF